MRLFHHLILILPIIFTSAAWADLPLTVENLMTNQNKFRLDLSLAYANSDRQGISTGEPIIVQTGATSFITLPTRIGESRGNSDTLIGTLGLRYGLASKAEIYTRASYLYNSSRNSDISGISSNSENRFTDAWVGVNYQFKQDDDMPAVLGFAEIALVEQHRETNSAFKSFLLGVTTYKAIDPVVLSFTTFYRINQSRHDGQINYQPGDMFLINPAVAFAVNECITLTTGVQWLNRQADTFDGITQGFRRTSTDLLLGVGYGISKDSTLNATFQTNASGTDGANLRLNWLHTF